MEKPSQDTPWIRLVTPHISQPSLKDNTADIDRLIRGLRKRLDVNGVTVAFSQVNDLARSLKEHHYDVCALVYEDGGAWQVADLFPIGDHPSIYGLAVDLGTSTVVVRLVELQEGETKDETTFLNPQIQLGPDILSRIHFAAQDGGLAQLQNLLLNRLNQEIEELIKRHDLTSPLIAGMAVAGNTTMTHLFLGLDPYGICREPYIPIINRPGLLKAGDLGLGINKEAPVLVFPNVGSYFGGDLISGILASGMTHQREIAFLVDVGTNAEVIIGNQDWLMGCAGAAGPALEGGVASMGMMAGPGVIDKVVIDPETLQFRVRTIEGGPPVGICGSGLIDLVAQLFLAGMIDLRGKFVRAKCGERLIEEEGIPHLVVVSAEESGTGKALTLSQPDIDALIRSKAAMYTILTTIANTVGIPLNSIERFYVAGTFGSYIDPASAITIGMIPDLPLEAYMPLGNTSLKGAVMGLVSARAREEAFRIRDQVTYLELNVNQEFMNLFSAAKFLPHTDRTLFPSVK